MLLLHVEGAVCAVVENSTALCYIGALPHLPEGSEAPPSSQNLNA